MKNQTIYGIMTRSKAVPSHTIKIDSDGHTFLIHFAEKQTFEKGEALWITGTPDNFLPLTLNRCEILKRDFGG